MNLLILKHLYFSRMNSSCSRTVAYQGSSMGFSRQEYWSGLPFPSPGDLPDPGIESRSPALEADKQIASQYCIGFCHTST